MDELRQRLSVAQPLITVTQVANMDDYDDALDDLQKAMDIIDEPGHVITGEELDCLYDAKDTLVRWRPELEAK